jgi:hypothetical protein
MMKRLEEGAQFIAEMKLNATSNRLWPQIFTRGQKSFKSCIKRDSEYATRHMRLYGIPWKGEDHRLAQRLAS